MRPKARPRRWYVERDGPPAGFALIFTDISAVPDQRDRRARLRLLVPYIAIGRTLLYFDLQLQA